MRDETVRTTRLLSVVNGNVDVAPLRVIFVTFMMLVLSLSVACIASRQTGTLSLLWWYSLAYRNVAHVPCGTCDLFDIMAQGRYLLTINTVRRYSKLPDVSTTG